jgi:hypothetical protein
LYLPCRGQDKSKGADRGSDFNQIGCIIYHCRGQDKNKEVDRGSDWLYYLSLQVYI